MEDKGNILDSILNSLILKINPKTNSEVNIPQSEHN